MNIDIHAHVIPREVLREQQPAEKWRPRVFRDEQGRQQIELGGNIISAALHESVDIEQILAAQEAATVDAVALSPWPTLLNYEMPAADGQRACRLYNEGIARLARDHPSRIAGMGIVPMQDPPLAAQEGEHAVRKLGLRAIELGTNVNGAYLGDEKMLPFWEAMAALDVLILVHPVPGVGGPLMRQYELGNLFGNPAETGLTTASLIFGGVLERFPSLNICMAHGGGVLPYIIGRLDHGYEMRVKGKTIITRPPSTYLRQLYFDTITHSAEALRYLITLAGADHVLLGSDYPFDMGNDRPVELVRRLALPGADSEAILGGNAARLLNWNAPG